MRVCVYACVCGCACVHSSLCVVEMFVCGCRVDMGVEVGFLPLSLSVLSFGHGFFTELQLACSAGLADQQAPGIFLALPPESVITGTLWSQAFYQALRRKLSSLCCTTSTSSHGLRDKFLQFQAPVYGFCHHSPSWLYIHRELG